MKFALDLDRSKALSQAQFARELTNKAWKHKQIHSHTETPSKNAFYELQQWIMLEFLVKSGTLFAPQTEIYWGSSDKVEFRSA